MEMRPFKPFGSVSALTLGGGGLGQVWGATTRDEAVATARLALESVIASDTPPTAVQCAVNPLNSVGGIAYVTESFDCRRVLDACRANSVPALAIRAVQAGALTSKMDRELPADDADQLDFDRAQGFRQLAADWGQTPARLAHRYALSIPDLGSVILGVKNRDELQECLQAERDPRLTPEEVADVEAACA